MNDPLNAWMNQTVVIDTDGPIVYLGRLTEVGENALMLADADVHDCRDGHASKEAYLAEALENGVTINRRRVAVLRRIIMSVSPLEDIVLVDLTGNDDLPEADLLMEDE